MKERFLSLLALSYFLNEETIYTLRHLKCIKLVSVRSSLPCFTIGVRIELTSFDPSA